MPLKREFAPTRSKSVVFASDRDEYPIFTGPKQKSRVMKERGMIEYGSETADTVRKYHEGIQRENEKQEEQDAYAHVMGALDELGDAGLYHSVPKHVSKREARAERDDELTGSGLVDDMPPGNPYVG